MTSQCMKLVLVSFTLIYSATCAFNNSIVISHHVLREALVANCYGYTWKLEPLASRASMVALNPNK